MTVHDHPERSKAQARGDQAERLLPLATELAFLVHTEDREVVGEWLNQHGLLIGARVTDDLRAFLVTLAATAPVDATPDQMLAWVTWDEYGRQLPGTARIIVSTDPVVDEYECGTMAGYRRHIARGEDDPAALEDCGCALANTAYKRVQRRKRGTAERTKRAERREKFAKLRHQQVPIIECARRIGIDPHTAQTYENEARAKGAATWRDDNGQVTDRAA